MKKIIAIVGFLGLFASQVVTSSAAYFNSAPIVRCETQITRTLQRGSENNDVFILQQMLVNAGFLHANPNGYFGYQTTQAVREFQINNDLRVTGSVDEMTWNAVNERLCDTDLLDNSYSYDSYGYSDYSNSGTTYVNQVDPYVNVKVITPENTNPAVYATPQNHITVPTIASSRQISSGISPIAISASAVAPNVSPFTSSQIAASGIVYNPSTGYSYGLIPKSGSITVTSPLANSVYLEGDTVHLSWSTNNLQTSTYSIILESTITGQSKTVAVVGGNSYSFVLTKELLDAVCSGTCNNNQQGSFKVVVSTPTTDIAGTTSNLRAAIAPITVKRPFAPGRLLLTVSKSPVASGEIFKLYVNAPVNSFENVRDPSYTLKIKSMCPSSVTISLAGATCGQEIVVPYNTTRLEQGVPVTVTNPTWYAQDVSFQIGLFNAAGVNVASAEAKVTVNSAPFSW